MLRATFLVAAVLLGLAICSLFLQNENMKGISFDTKYVYAGLLCVLLVQVALAFRSSEKK